MNFFSLSYNVKQAEEGLAEEEYHGLKIYDNGLERAPNHYLEQRCSSMCNGDLSKSVILEVIFADGTSYDYVIRPAKYYEYESLVLYSCQNNGNGSSVLAWKLGKNLTQSPEAKNATEKIIASINDLTNATWRTTSFSDAACKNDAGEHLHAGMAFYKLLVALALVKGY
ncbi:jg25487 [Pararge aegeria aegeria]|uniref:Jg25487 protein n=1 Tax=Pararge aegeria aegeria TaxID=348720 RepID=A0A8S4QMG3_9NEOP|nr:jg25487 [Pararge aegeria aegeria]